MQKEKMWAYMLQLGSNMWGKQGETRPYFMEWEELYHETMVTDRATWRRVTDFLPECGINTLLIDLGEGVKLDSHPELAVPGAWEKQELAEELVRLREMGLTPVPKFNFSCGHNAWMGEYTHVVGTETYYRVCRELVEETIELFGQPEFFHLGLDEENAPQQQYVPVATVRAPYKQIADALALFAVCKSHGVRPWMWIDAHSIKSFGGEEAFCAKIPKEVLISNWFYQNPFHPQQPERVELYNKLGEWGYEQVPTCSTCSGPLNSRQTMRYCRETVKPESIRGYLTAPWILTDAESCYGLLNAAWRFGCAKKTIYGEE